MKQFKKFTLSYLFFITVFAICIIAVNWLVNPYDIYNPPHFKYFEKKPLVSTHLRLVKAMAIQLKKPEYIILGSSTAETGFDPDKLSADKNNSYNLGLPGANIYEVLRYLQHAQSIKPLKKVILVVNFFMFNAYLDNKVDFDETILNVDKNETKSQRSLNTLSSTLISFDALKASIETIKGQNADNVYQNNGQLMINFREKQISKLKGYKKNFELVESYNKETFFPPPQKEYSFKNPQSNVNTFNYLSKIIDICEKNNTELVIVIAPEHVRLLETYKLLNLWDKYEEWQVRIGKLIDQHNKKYPEHPFKIWAFNKINYISSERLPDSSESIRSMKWFWDPFHFKNALGNLILDYISDEKNLNNISNIASSLTESTLNKTLKANRRMLSRWESLNTKLVEELKINLNKSKNQNANL